MILSRGAAFFHPDWSLLICMFPLKPLSKCILPPISKFLKIILSIMLLVCDFNHLNFSLKAVLYLYDWVQQSVLNGGEAILVLQNFKKY